MISPPFANTIDWSTTEVAVCPFCRNWRHRSQFSQGAKSCRWCRAAFRAKRDHGVRNGLYSVDELTTVFLSDDPPEPWKEDSIWMAEYSQPPTLEQLNAPYQPTNPEEEPA